MIRATLLAVMAVCASAAYGQSADAPLRFEVVSIKSSAPPVDANGGYRVRLRVDPGRLDYSNATLRAIIQRAFEVQSFQIIGPEWISSTRFDVVGKLPAGAPASRAPEMLRSMLTERFQIEFHRESRELPIYALVLGKSKPRMKESADGPKPPPTEPTGSMINKAFGQLEVHMMNMASLARVLAALLGCHVVDQTGLTGTYDFDLNYVPDEGPRPASASPPRPPKACPSSLRSKRNSASNWNPGKVRSR